MTACNEDFDDWKQQATNTQGATVTFGNDGSVAEAALIDFATIPEDQDSVKVCTITEPTSSYSKTVNKYVITLNAKGVEKKFDLDDEGRVLAKDLREFIETNYGKNPNNTNVMTAVVTAYTGNGATAVKNVLATSGSFTVKAKVKAPFIDPAGYYIVGNVDGWKCVKIAEYHLVNNGGDVYENPVFTFTMENDLTKFEGITTFEIKLIPASAFNEDGSIGNWGIALASAKDEVAYKGNFTWDNTGSNIKFAADANAKFYRFTFDLLAGTYEITPLSFSAYFYEIGSESGWSTSHALYGGNGDGKYLGYYYLNGEYKFKPNADNWDGDLEYVEGTTMGGTLTASGGPNCPDPGAGFYQINLDAAALSYSLVKVNNISIIGTVNGNWDTDTDLTYNTETGAWEVTTTLAAGNMKFRMNHDWAISWGGANGDPAAFDNLTEYNGKDLAVEAGTYKIQLFISHEGKNKVVMTKQ